MRYVITARKTTLDAGSSTASEAAAIAVVRELTDRGFEILSLVDDFGRHATIEELHEIIEHDIADQQRLGGS